MENIQKVFCCFEVFSLEVSTLLRTGRPTVRLILEFSKTAFEISQKTLLFSSLRWAPYKTVLVPQELICLSKKLRVMRTDNKRFIF